MTRFSLNNLLILYRVSQHNYMNDAPLESRHDKLFPYKSRSADSSSPHSGLDSRERLGGGGGSSVVGGGGGRVNPQVTFRTLLSTTVVILSFYKHMYSQLLKVKYAFNLKTLIYVGI